MCAGEPWGEEREEEGEAHLPTCQKCKIQQLPWGNPPLAESAKWQQLRSRRAHTAGDAFCAGWHSDSRGAECPTSGPARQDAAGKQGFELPLSEEMVEF